MICSKGAYECIKNRKNQHFTANTDNLLFIFKRKTIFVKRKFRHGVNVHALHCGMLTQVTDSASGLVGPGPSKRQSDVIANPNDLALTPASPGEQTER